MFTFLDDSVTLSLPAYGFMPAASNTQACRVNIETARMGTTGNLEDFRIVGFNGVGPCTNLQFASGDENCSATHRLSRSAFVAAQACPFSSDPSNDRNPAQKPIGSMIWGSDVQVLLTGHGYQT